MKYCKNCGFQLADEAGFCTNCGSAVEQAAPQQAYAAPQQPYAAPQQPYAAPKQGYVPQQGYVQAAPKVSGLATAAKVLMIISTVVMGLYLIPLAWCIPMTISYNNALKNGRPVSTGFKICTLLFVNTISGILMLCDKDH